MITLLAKSEILSIELPLSLYSPFCIGPGRKPKTGCLMTQLKSNQPGHEESLQYLVSISEVSFEIRLDSQN